MSEARESEPPVAWEVDVLVAGSGAGGMIAALAAQAEGLETLLVEKAAVFGGTTALSGGGVWIPNAPQLVRVGQRSDPKRVLSYLENLVAGAVPRARLERYVEAGPEMMAFVERRSPYLSDAFAWVDGYSDYHPELGGSERGNGLWPKPIDLAVLGDDADALRPPYMRGPKGMWMTSAEFRRLIGLGWGWSGKVMLARLAVRIARGRLTGKRVATGGQALIARLRLALRDAGIPLLLETPLLSLVVDGDGHVVGAEVERAGERIRIGVRRGLILATGGFDHDRELRRRHLGEVAFGWSMGSPDNTGDGIRAGAAAGAALELMDDAWWMPALEMPGGFIYPALFERNAPGNFIVNGAGRRFVNESAPYTDFCRAQIEGHRTGVKHIPAWLVLDSRAWRRSVFAGHLPRRPMPVGWVESGFAKTAESLEELARQIAVPADALRETTRRFNEFARGGVDRDFGRGASAYDRYYGDPSLPNPNLAEVSRPPFYAFALVPGDLGTKGGLVTDETGRVLRGDGTPIEGLYATGNTSASVMGRSYAGPGATIGPAMVFGYLAARHAAQAKPA